MKYLVTALVLALGESAVSAAGAFLHHEAARIRSLEEPVSLPWMAVVSAGMLVTIAMRCHAAPPRGLPGWR